MEEGVADLVAALKSACALDTATHWMGHSRDKVLLVSKLQLGCDVVELLLFFLQQSSAEPKRFFFCNAHGASHVLDLQLLFYRELALVQAAELVDLVLVLTADLDLFSDRIFVLLGQLCNKPSAGPRIAGDSG